MRSNHLHDEKPFESNTEGDSEDKKERKTEKEDEENVVAER